MLYFPQCVREFNIMNVNADCVVIYSDIGRLNSLKLDKTSQCGAAEHLCKSKMHG